MNSYKREKENLHKETLKVWCKSLVCSLRAINHDLYLLCFKNKCRGSTNKSDGKKWKFGFRNTQIYSKY